MTSIVLAGLYIFPSRRREDVSIVRISWLSDSSVHVRSISINHLKGVFHQKKAAVLYGFCNHLVSSLLRQIAQSRITSNLDKFYKENKDSDKRPSLDDVKEIVNLERPPAPTAALPATLANHTPASQPSSCSEALASRPSCSLCIGQPATLAHYSSASRPPLPTTHQPVGHPPAVG